MRGDDSVLLFLVVAFLGAAIAWAYWGGTDAELDGDEENGNGNGLVDWILREPDSVASRTVNWFTSLFAGDPSDKTTGGTTPKEDVDPGDTEK